MRIFSRFNLGYLIKIPVNTIKFQNYFFKQIMANYSNDSNISSNDLKKSKRIVFQNKNDYNNKILSIKSPCLNKRYRYSVLPTVIQVT